MIRITNVTSTSSPAEFKLVKESPIEPTSAMIFGEALHKFILEKSKFDEYYRIIETDELNKDGTVKAAVLKKLDLGTKIPISGAVFEYFLKVEKLINIKGYKALLDTSIIEERQFGAFHVPSQEFIKSEKTDKDFDKENLYLSGKPDIYNKNFIIDLKTVRIDLLTNNRLYYEFRSNGYLMQLYAYKKLLLANEKTNENANLLILAVSNDIELPEIQLFSISDNDEFSAYNGLLNRLTTLHQCFLENNFPVIPINRDIIPLNEQIYY